MVDDATRVVRLLRSGEQPAAVLVTGSECTDVCVDAISQVRAKIVEVDLLDLSAPNSMLSSLSSTSLAKYNWCGKRESSIVLVDDIDIALTVHGQHAQAALLQLVSKTLRSGQHIMLTSSTTHTPLSGCGKVMRSIVQLVTDHVRTGAPAEPAPVRRQSSRRKAAPASCAVGADLRRAAGRANEAAIILSAFAGSLESTDSDTLQYMADELQKMENMTERNGGKGTPVDQKGGGVASMTKEMILSLIDSDVTKKLTKWTASFFDDQRKSTAALANRIDVIVDAFTTSCSPDYTDDVEFLEMPTHQAQMLDKLRKDKPDIFSLMSSKATDIVKADPLQRKEKLKAAIQDLLKAAGDTKN